MKLETQMRLSANLKQLRKLYGFSQAELAGKIGMDRSVLALYESGKRCPDLETLYDIALVYGLSMEILLEAEPAQIACYAANRKIHEVGERELLCIFRRLTSLSQGRLLEKAQDLADRDSTYSESEETGKVSLVR